MTADEPLFYARLTRPPLKRVRKLLVIGNSVTRHGPSAKLGWHGNWGMAATALERDFAHVLHGYLCQAQPKHKPQLVIENLVARSLPGQTGAFEKQASHQADLIVVQIGDNLAESAATQESLGAPYERLLKRLRKDGDSLIIGVSTWGGGAKRDLLMQRACRNQGVPFVRISHLIGDRANRAESEGHFQHRGVNWHPGDRGMKAIADTLWSALQRELAAGPRVSRSPRHRDSDARQSHFGRPRTPPLTGITIRLRPRVRLPRSGPISQAKS